MIRRRADPDDGKVHMWLNDATGTADQSVCGKAGPPSPHEGGPPCMTCVMKHGTDLANKHGDVTWPM